MYSMSRLLHLYQTVGLPNFRSLSTTAVRRLREVNITEKGNTTIVEGVYVPSDRTDRVIEVENKKQLCPLCPNKLGCKIQYTDVLIISQFLNTDGEILDRRVTGLCKRAQRRLRFVTLRAQRAGLIPQLVQDEPGGKVYDMRDFKWRRYNCYFEEGFESALSDE